MYFSFFLFFENSFAQDFTANYNTGKLAYEKKNYNKAIQSLQTARLQGKESVGDTHPDYIHTIEYLALSYQSQNDLGNANIYFQSLEKLLYKSGNSVSEKMSETQIRIADNSLHMKNFAQASIYYEKGVATTEKVAGKDSKAYASALHKNALLYVKGRKYKEADGMYRTLNPIAEKHLKGTAEFASILSEQADISMGLKHVEEASIQLSMAISEYEKIDAPKSSYVGLYLKEATLLEKTGKNAEAITAYKKYAKNLGEAYGIDNKKYLSEVERLAVHVDMKLHSEKDAYGFIKMKSEGIKKKNGEESLEAAITYIELAELEINQKQIDVALSNTEKALAIYEVKGKTKSPEGIAALITKARIMNIKDAPEAEETYKKIIADTESALGKEHTTYGKALDSLAFFYIEAKRFEEAEKAITEGMTAREKSVGKQHIDYGNSLYSLATLYSSQDSLEKAEKALIQVSKVREAYYGALTLEHATCIKELGDLYKDMGEEKSAAALKTYRRAINLFEGIGMKDSDIVRDIYKSIDHINTR
ncbi:tetratricopeptide repeat protein [Flammeovirga sp. MY04]|uniref:tetratricopeptide repeat protein n=1 Tax=Flammeovirga sp. MY04 TaxID=1191459 RepID=UPI0008064388|nr:tetratricopeptide repeat protein [Flammeovirga sp. MY04]ANQ50381.1 tetratricopeptide repeat protein [Flammeovirga sp. MY04]